MAEIQTEHGWLEFQLPLCEKLKSGEKKKKESRRARDTLLVMVLLILSLTLLCWLLNPALDLFLLLGIFTLTFSFFLFWNPDFQKIFSLLLSSGLFLLYGWGLWQLALAYPEAGAVFGYCGLYIAAIMLQVMDIASRVKKFRQMGEEADIVGLVSEIKSAGYTNSEMVAENIGRLADEGKAKELVQGGAVEALISNLKYEDDTGDIRDALWRIARAGERDYVVARLLEGLEPEVDSYIQFLGLELLGRLKDPSVIPAIEKFLAEEGGESEWAAEFTEKIIKQINTEEDWTVEDFDPSEDEAFDILEGMMDEMKQDDAARTQI